jgi:acetyl-CoA acetyltransferase
VSSHFILKPSRLVTNSDSLQSTQKNADDIVITLAIRTPLAKGHKGGFKDTSLDFMIFSLLKKVLEKSKIDPALVEDVCLGNVRSVTSRPRTPSSNH